jgi:hypothetical protein
MLTVAVRSISRSEKFVKESSQLEVQILPFEVFFPMATLPPSTDQRAV